jgi:hypothetical protein
MLISIPMFLANTAVAVFRINNFWQLEWVALFIDLTGIGGLEVKP